MLTIEIGLNTRKDPRNPNKQPLPLCKAIQLEKAYGDRTDGKYLSLSFSWLASDPLTGRTGIENTIIPLYGIGIPKPTMGVFFLVQDSKPMVVKFENVKEGITVECVGKSVPIDFTLKLKVLE